MASRQGGGSGWTGLVVGALVALFSVLIAVQVGLGGSVSAHVQRWLILVSCGVGAFVLAALLFAIAGRGGRAIAQLRPGAAIARASRTDDGRDAFRVYFRSIGFHRYKVSQTFWLVADPDGLAVWNTKNPAASVTIPWGDVVSIEPAEVNMPARVSNGVVVRLRSGGRELSAPIGFIGSGLAGMYPPPAQDVQDWVRRAAAFDHVG